MNIQTRSHLNQFDPTPMDFKGFGDWIELNPIKGIKDFNKGITSGDLDRLATPPMMGDAARPSVAWNYTRATYDPSYGYSFGKDTKRNQNATPQQYGTVAGSKQVTVKAEPVDTTSAAQSYLRQAAEATQRKNTTGRTLLNG